MYESIRANSTARRACQVDCSGKCDGSARPAKAAPNAVRPAKRPAAAPATPTATSSFQRLTATPGARRAAKPPVTPRPTSTVRSTVSQRATWTARLDIKGGCEADCKTEEGALFCDSQYVDHGDNLNECINALEAVLTTDVEGYASGSASCEGGTLQVRRLSGRLVQRPADVGRQQRTLGPAASRPRRLPPPPPLDVPFPLPCAGGLGRGSL